MFCSVKIFYLRNNVIQKKVKAYKNILQKSESLPAIDGIKSFLEEVSEGKPSPEEYLRTAEKLNLNPSKCLAIEDRPNGVEAAKNAGMKIVALTTCYQHEAFGMADFVEDNF